MQHWPYSILLVATLPLWLTACAAATTLPATPATATTRIPLLYPRQTPTLAAAPGALVTGLVVDVVDDDAIDVQISGRELRVRYIGIAQNGAKACTESWR